MASVAHDGYALTIRPVHTMNDGDTLFALSYGEKREDMTVLCAAAVEAVAGPSLMRRWPEALPNDQGDRLRPGADRPAQAAFK